MEAIYSALDSWIENRGFSNQDVSLAKLAQSIGIPAQMLSRYIGISQGVTFRVWLSKIRIGEAKRILISNPEATIEYIAEECGFSSRRYFQNLFNHPTRMAPENVWFLGAIHFFLASHTLFLRNRTCNDIVTRYICTNDKHCRQMSSY